MTDSDELKPLSFFLQSVKNGRRHLVGGFSFKYYKNVTFSSFVAYYNKFL